MNKEEKASHFKEMKKKKNKIQEGKKKKKKKMPDFRELRSVWAPA